MIAFWIFLTLSVSHLALAAPVAVGELVEVRPDPAQVLNDVMATWEKRRDPNDKDQSSTNKALLLDNGPGDDVHLPDGELGDDSDHPDDVPGAVQESVHAEGVKPEEMGMSRWGWEWDLPWDVDQLTSGSAWGSRLDSHPVRIWKILFNPPTNPQKLESDGSGGSGGGDGRAVHSLQGSGENMDPRPQPPSEDPGTPDLMTSIKEWLKVPGQPPKVFRPRNFGAGAVRTPNKVLKGTIEAKT